MKIINVPLSEHDANMVEVALGRSDILDFICKQDGDDIVVKSLARLHEALIKAINDSW